MSACSTSVNAVTRLPNLSPACLAVLNGANFGSDVTVTVGNSRAQVVSTPAAGENTRRTVAQATRTAYFGLVSGQGQVKALEAAEASSQSALEANQLGYQVGVRINIDVLNAQSQLFQTKRDLAQARYNVLLGNLKLRQANGTLVPEDLAKLNTLVTQKK